MLGMRGLVSAVILAALASGCNSDPSGTFAHEVQERAAVPTTGAAGSLNHVSESVPLVSGDSGRDWGALNLAGTPPAIISVGDPYSFQPVVSSATGGRVLFTIQNKPRWASFNQLTGTLSGIPDASSVGEYGPIVVSASNGKTTAALPDFFITVTESAVGSVMLSWTAPTTNTNGSAITDLAGYQIAYGTSASRLTHSIKVNGTGLTNYLVDNLTPGTWYFSISAYNGSGILSPPTAVVSASVATRTDWSAHIGGGNARLSAGP